jgi:nucleoside-diphosphate-sugar epimerase
MVHTAGNQMVVPALEAEIMAAATKDQRSVQEIKRELGFVPKYTVEDAVRDLCKAFSEGKLPNSFDDDKYFNIATMKAVGAK